MSNNIADLSVIIKNKILSVTKLVDVYDYVPASLSGTSYPFATMHFASSNAVFGDNKRNLRNYIFNCNIYVERTQAGFGNEKSERIMREICDQIITAFDNDTTLNGAVQKVTPISVETDFEDTDISDTRIAKIVIEIMKVVDSA